ncbi:MAG: hypothetical protein ACXIUD_11860 [Mongoliitalea sp.]
MHTKNLFNRQFTLILLSLGVWLLVLLLLGGLDGERDVPMMWLVSGAYTGEVEYYTGFLHPILSGLLASLYSSSPSVPWYSIVWYVIISICFYQFIGITSQIANNKWIISLLIASFLLILLGQITALSYTLVAGLATAVGLGGLIAASQHGKTFAKYQFISSSLLLVAVLVDYKTFFLLFWITLAYLLIFLSKQVILSFFKVNRTIFILMLLLISIQGGFRFSLKYSSFEKFTQARTSVIDHPVFQFSMESNPSAMDNSWVYFSHGLQEKTDAPSLEELETMLAVLKRGYWKQAYFQFYVSQLFTGLANNILLISLVGAVLLILILYSSHTRQLLFFIGLLGIVQLAHAYLYGFSGSISIGLLVLLLGLGIINFSNQPKTVHPWIIYSLVFAIGAMVLYQGVQVLQEQSERKSKFRELEACLEFVPDEQLIIYMGQDRGFFPVSSYKQRFPFTILDWFSRSPMQQKRYADYGVKTWEDAPQLYIIQPKGSETMSNYLQEFFGGYNLEQVGISGTFEVLRVWKREL